MSVEKLLALPWGILASALPWSFADARAINLFDVSHMAVEARRRMWERN